MMSQADATLTERTCPNCKGTGKGPCGTCGGTNTYRARDGREITPCWDCNGSTDVEWCGTCDGVGEVPCHCGADLPTLPDGCCDACSDNHEPCPQRRQP